MQNKTFFFKSDYTSLYEISLVSLFPFVDQMPKTNSIQIDLTILTVLFCAYYSEVNPNVYNSKWLLAVSSPFLCQSVYLCCQYHNWKAVHHNQHRATVGRFLASRTLTKQRLRCGSRRHEQHVYAHMPTKVKKISG